MARFSAELVRQWHHAGLDGRQQQVVFQRIQQQAAAVVCRICSTLGRTLSSAARSAAGRCHRVFGWQPDAVGTSPPSWPLDDATRRGLPVNQHRSPMVNPPPPRSRSRPRCGSAHVIEGEQLLDPLAAFVRGTFFTDVNDGLIVLVMPMIRP